MDHISLYKKWVTAGEIILLVVLSGAALVFRDKVRSSLDFGEKSAENPGVPLSRPLYGDGKTSEGSTSPLSAADSKEGDRNIKKESPFPAYQGRSPAEIRPQAKETALFTDKQKNEIFSEIRLYAQSVKDDPSLSQMWIQLGLLKKTIGDYEGTKDAWEYAATLRPEDGLIFANLGELYWRYLPDFPRAERDFLKAIANDSLNISYYIKLSEFYSFGDTTKADKTDDVLLQGIDQTNDANLMRALASFYERTKEYQNALLWWEKILEKEPKNTLVMQSVEELKKKIASP